MADLLPSIPDASASEDAEPRVVGLEDDDADDVLGALSSTTARELFAALTDDPAHPSALAERVDTSLQNVQYHLGKLEDAGMVEVVDTAYSAKGREMDVYAPADRPLVLFAGDEEDQTLLDRALGRLLGGVGVLAGASLTVRGLATAGGPTGGTNEAEYTSRSAGGAPAANQSAEGVDDTTYGDSGGGDGAASETTTGDTTSGTESGGEPTGGGGADSGSLSDDVATDDQSAAAGSDQSVEPLASEFAWLADPLDATALPPELFVFLVGACLLAVGVGAWYWRKRQTRV